MKWSRALAGVYATNVAGYTLRVRRTNSGIWGAEVRAPDGALYLALPRYRLDDAKRVAEDGARALRETGLTPIGWRRV